jgi:CheY-like chemotaxis protein
VGNATEHISPKSAQRILLVDDNVDTVHIVTVFLEARGYDCDVAKNGAEACRVLEDEDFDLVLMDLQMPQMDGIEATRYIRSQKNLRDLPVIGLSAHGLKNEKTACLNAGMTDYIVKPFSSSDLYETISKYI